MRSRSKKKPIVITASGFLNDANDFALKVHNALSIVGSDDCKITPIKWRNIKETDLVDDLLATRTFNNIVKETLEIISEAIYQADQTRNRIVIISHSAGSVVIEAALVILQKTVIPEIIHIMLAPALSGSNLALAFNISRPFLTYAMTKSLIESTKNSWLQLLFGVAGVVVGYKMMQQKDIISQLSGSFEEEISKNPSISRLVLKGTCDEVVRSVEVSLPNCLYYEGEFKHNQVGDLTDIGMRQTYEMVGQKFRLLKRQIFEEAFKGSSNL